MINVAVVGLGAIGQEHVATLGALPGVRISAVADPRETAAAFVAAQTGAVAYSCAQEIIDARAADAVVLATPDHLHESDAAALIKAGIPLLLEKPVTAHAEQADRLVALVRQYGTLVMPGHTLRFEPRYAAARDGVGNGMIGEVEHGYLRRDNKRSVAARASGRVSVSFFLAIHDIDALMWVTGEPVVEVQAMAARATEPTGQQASAVLGCLRLQSGAAVQVEASWNLPESYPTELDARLRLVGSAGVVSIDSFDSGIQVTASAFTLPMPQGRELYGMAQGALAVEDAAFLRCVETGQAPPVTIEQAAYAVRVVEALDAAAASGQTVILPPAEVRWR